MLRRVALTLLILALSEIIPRAFTGHGDYLFHRTSEVQELFFYLFILLYLLVLRYRLKDPETLQH